MQYHRLTVDRVVEETADTRSFVLTVPPELAGTFEYQAGQFLTFRVPWEGSQLIRCYSLASCPATEKEWKVTVKRVDQGRVSNWFNDQLQPGKEIEVLPPTGRFVLRDSEAPLLLFAGGSGITPVISLIKTSLAKTSRRMRLLYANRDLASVIFDAELRKLEADSGGRLEVMHRLDDRDGFLDDGSAASAAAGFEAAEAYVCGPGPFMDIVEAALAAVAFDGDRIFIERFESPADGEAPEVVLSAEEQAEAPTQLTVTLGGTEHSVPYTAGQTILRAAIAAGLDAPFACEEGYCGSCAAKRLEGEVEMAVNDVFNAAEVADGWVLTCQGRAARGHCRITYDD